LIYDYTIDQVIFNYEKILLTTGHVSELKNNPIISSWLLSIDTSANTERNYLQAIKAFCEFTEKCL